MKGKVYCCSRLLEQPSRGSCLYSQLWARVSSLRHISKLGGFGFVAIETFSAMESFSITHTLWNPMERKVRQTFSLYAYFRMWHLCCENGILVSIRITNWVCGRFGLTWVATRWVIRWLVWGGLSRGVEYCCQVTAYRKAFFYLTPQTIQDNCFLRFFQYEVV